MKNSWPIKKLGEVTKNSKGSGKLAKSNFRLSGKYPVIDQSQMSIAGYTDDQNYLYKGELPVVVFGDHTQVLKYLDEPFVRGADGTQIITPDVNYVEPKFLYYVLSNTPLKNVGYERHYKYLKEEEFPVPPISIQKRIVERLDAIRKAQELCDTQISKIEELFNSLIFKELEKIKIDTKPFDEVCSFQYGYTQSAADTGKYRFIRITDIDDYGEIKNDDEKYISDNAELLQPYILHKGDLLVARTGATYGKVLYFDLEKPAVFASYLIRIIPNLSIILSKFIWLFSRSNSYWKQAKRLVSGSGQPQFNANKLKEIKLKVPSIQSQKRIIEKLDAIQDYKKLLLKQKSLLKELFDSVLYKSVNGEMDN